MSPVLVDLTKEPPVVVYSDGLTRKVSRDEARAVAVWLLRSPA